MTFFEGGRTDMDGGRRIVVWVIPCLQGKYLLEDIDYRKNSLY